MMRLVVEGVMGGSFPKNLVLTGAGLAAILTLARLPALAISLGVYRPIHLDTAMLVGSVIRHLVTRRRTAASKFDTDRGVWFSSGLIAGEGVIGIGPALAAVIGLKLSLADSGTVLGAWAGAPGLVLLSVILTKMAKEPKT